MVRDMYKYQVGGGYIFDYIIFLKNKLFKISH